MGIGEILLFLWLVAIVGYICCVSAYNQGRKSKWKEMCSNYICIHKSVCVNTKNDKKVKTPKKTLTNKKKKDRIKRVIKRTTKTKPTK